MNIFLSVINNGIIITWGHTTATEKNLTINLPISYTTVFRVANCRHMSSTTTTGYMIAVTSQTTSTITVKAGSSSAVTTSCSYIIIGF